jgi:hypothetical protein
MTHTSTIGAPHSLCALMATSFLGTAYSVFSSRASGVLCAGDGFPGCSNLSHGAAISSQMSLQYHKKKEMITFSIL